MSPLIKELHPDHRHHGALPDGISMSSVVLAPVLFLTTGENGYKALLGAKVRKKGVFRFVAALSTSHNWVIDGNRIKPLPVDISDIIAGIIGDIELQEITFSKIIYLSRQTFDGIKVEVDSNLFKKANNQAATIENFDSIDGLQAKLYPYQQQGVQWMHQTLGTTGGVILSDEMGLGKTLQIIALFLLNPIDNQHPALIVCPTSLIANWTRELQRFAPSLTFIVHRGANRVGYYKGLLRSQIVITTYDTLVNDITVFSGVKWTFAVYDEAQALKNPNSKRRKRISSLSSKYSIPVTGTPVENSLKDLWSLVDIAIPGLLGSSSEFDTYYPDTDEGADSLALVIDPVVLKRQVKDVANDLPERTDIDLPVIMDEHGANEYDRIRQETIAKYGRAGNLVSIGQLSIFSAHPWLKIKDPLVSDWEDQIELREDPAYPLITPKMDLCLNILREAFLTKKKVLVFATFNHCGELLKRAADKVQLPQAYWNAINGGTAQEDRQQIVDDFSSFTGPAVLILNPKAAGAGLNITAATIVIHYTQNWNPALELQASARAHRRGQTLPVTVYRLFYQDTVEEIMVQRSEWKRSLGETAVPVSTRDKDDMKDALEQSPRQGTIYYE